MKLYSDVSELYLLVIKLNASTNPANNIINARRAPAVKKSLKTVSWKQSSESERGLIPCQAKSQRLARPQVAFAPRSCGAAFFKLSCRHHSRGKCNFRRHVSFWCIARQACGRAEHVRPHTQTTHTRARRSINAEGWFLSYPAADDHL